MGSNHSHPSNAAGDPQPHDHPALSYESNKLHRDLAQRFLPIELLSLRHVFHKLHTAQQPASLPGISEATFVHHLAIPTPRAAALFFRSFYNLSTYPDNPALLHQHPTLSQRDLIKPLALYCHKVDHSTLHTKPLKVIFESFANTPAPDTNTTTTTTTTADDWDPHNDDDLDTGPFVAAQDLVDILQALFWIVQNLVHRRDHPSEHSTDSLSSSSSSSHRATRMVQHLIQYSKPNHTPSDLASERVNFTMFERYVSRNIPNIFKVLSQYFYSLFLIGDTMNPADSATQGQPALPAVSSVPILSSPSAILNTDDLALLSWFIPSSASSDTTTTTTPTLTNLYTGSQHGFSMNQFEVHVCKYPAPTVLLLLVEQLNTNVPIRNRRQSISFDATSLRQRHSIPSSPYGTLRDAQRSIEKLAASGTSANVLNTNANVLNTIVDGVPMTTTTTTTTVEPSETDPTTNSTATPTSPTRNTPRSRLVLGAYLGQPWKVSKSAWGNDSFAVFELDPNFEVFPARKSNSPGVNGHYAHFLKNAGVGFGGQASETCLLYMDDNLQYGGYKQDLAGGNVYMSAGGSRQSGYDIAFEIVECEVWGLGGPDATARQQKEWDFERREANRRASIQLRGKDGEQDIDRDLLEMAGVLDPDRGHRHTRRQSEA
ncbi:Restriction of telomere capping protein 5 [Mortierella sp. GBA43]|nr:Restriction of telomere capping protein 5 [Mortierella sp. GBA43]